MTVIFKLSGSAAYRDGQRAVIISCHITVMTCWHLTDAMCNRCCYTINQSPHPHRLWSQRCPVVSN